MGKERTGYLVLADISGYTAFLTGTEVEHAQAIIEDLMSVILGAMVAPFRLVKLEGDAAFLHAPGEAITTERVLEMFENCYVSFHDRLRDVKLATTCTCTACKSMVTLDLKFFAHFGSYLVQRLAGTAEDVAGPAVILVHRLLKNTVAEDIGTSAYALLTQPCVERLRSRPEDLVDHDETYEHLGKVNCVVQDLRPVLEEARTSRTVYIGEKEADIEMTADLPAPPAVVWEYTIDAEKVNLWKGGQTSTNKPAKGRMRREAEQHCAHGASVTVLQFTDLRPFRYYSHCSGRGTMMGLDCTYEFRALPDGGTRLINRFYFHRRGLVAAMMGRVFSLMFSKKVQDDYARLRALLEALPKDQEPEGAVPDSQTQAAT